MVTVDRTVDALADLQQFVNDWSGEWGDSDEREMSKRAIAALDTIRAALSPAPLEALPGEPTLALIKIITALRSEKRYEMVATLEQVLDRIGYYEMRAAFAISPAPPVAEPDKNNPPPINEKLREMYNSRDKGQGEYERPVRSDNAHAAPPVATAIPGEVEIVGYRYRWEYTKPNAVWHFIDDLKRLPAEFKGDIEPLVPALALRSMAEARQDVLAHLVAATSLLERGGKQAAPSDKMFAQMIADYNASIERGRRAAHALFPEKK